MGGKEGKKRFVGGGGGAHQELLQQELGRREGNS